MPVRPDAKRFPGVDPKADALAVLPKPQEDTRPDDALGVDTNAGEGHLHALCQSLQGVNIPLAVVIQLMAIFLVSATNAFIKCLKCIAEIVKCGAKCGTVTVNNTFSGGSGGGFQLMSLLKWRNILTRLLPTVALLLAVWYARGLGMAVASWSVSIFQAVNPFAARVINPAKVVESVEDEDTQSKIKRLEKEVQELKSERDGLVKTLNSTTTEIKTCNSAKQELEDENTRLNEKILFGSIQNWGFSWDNVVAGIAAYGVSQYNTKV
jgi:hypothetical protein